MNTTSKENGFTPLMWAAKKGDENCVRFLLARNAKINLQYKNTGKSAVYYAIEKDQLQIARLLIELPIENFEVASYSGGEKHQVNLYGFTAERVRDSDFIKKIFTRENSFVEDSGGYTPLMLAARAGNKDAVGAIMDCLPSSINMVEYVAKKVGKETAQDMAVDAIKSLMGDKIKSLLDEK